MHANLKEVDPIDNFIFSYNKSKQEQAMADSQRSEPNHFIIFFSSLNLK